MRKRVLLLALTFMMMSLGIPAFARQPERDTTVALRNNPAELIEKVKSYDMTHEEAIEFHKKLVESEYVIEIGKISKKTKATSDEYKNYSNKKTYKVPEGISLKELIARLPGVKTDKDGKLITSQKILLKYLISIIIWRTLNIGGFHYMCLVQIGNLFILWILKSRMELLL